MNANQQEYINRHDARDSIPYYRLPYAKKYSDTSRRGVIYLARVALPGQ